MRNEMKMGFSDRFVAAASAVGAVVSSGVLGYGALLYLSVEGTGPGGGAIAIPIMLAGVLIGMVGVLGLVVTLPLLAVYGRRLVASDDDDAGERR